MRFYLEYPPHASAHCTPAGGLQCQVNTTLYQSQSKPTCILPFPVGSNMVGGLSYFLVAWALTLLDNQHDNNPDVIGQCRKLLHRIFTDEYMRDIRSSEEAESGWQNCISPSRICAELEWSFRQVYLIHNFLWEYGADAALLYLVQPVTVKLRSRLKDRMSIWTQRNWQKRL